MRRRREQNQCKQEPEKAPRSNPIGTFSSSSGKCIARSMRSRYADAETADVVRCRRNSRLVRMMRSVVGSVLLSFLSSSYLSVPTCHGFITTLPQPSFDHSHRSFGSYELGAPTAAISLMALRNNNDHPNEIHRVCTNLSQPSTTNTPLPAITTPICRSRFLSKSTSVAFLLSALLHPTPSSASPPTTTEQALTQLNDAIATTDQLLKNWDTVSSQGGDAIRVELGTNGGRSPLFQINKAVRVLQADAEDPVAFAEASEEYLLGVGRADSMAYSANFAGGSGKPTPPAVYIAKSKGEVELLKRYEKEMLAALGK